MQNLALFVLAVALGGLGGLVAMSVSPGLPSEAFGQICSVCMLGASCCLQPHIAVTTYLKLRHVALRIYNT